MARSVHPASCGDLLDLCPCVLQYRAGRAQPRAHGHDVRRRAHAVARTGMAGLPRPRMNRACASWSVGSKVVALYSQTFLRMPTTGRRRAMAADWSMAETRGVRSEQSV